MITGLPPLTLILKLTTITLYTFTFSLDLPGSLCQVILKAKIWIGSQKVALRYQELKSEKYLLFLLLVADLLVNR